MAEPKKFNVDWSFISDREGGSKSEGYIPTNKDTGDVVGKSGLTIATGWDVGQMSEDEIEESGLPASVISKVKDFAGLKGQSALDMLEEKGAPSINSAEAAAINTYTHSKTLKAISTNYKLATGKSFKDLTKAQQTVVSSVGFQYGAEGLMTKTDKKTGEKVPTNFWKQITEGKWNDAYKNLQNYGDDYPTRRKLEAELLSVDLFMQEAKTRDEPLWSGFKEQIAAEVNPET